MLRKYYIGIKAFTLALAAAVCASGAESNGPAPVDILGASRQAILVLTENWPATNGWLQRFDLENETWVARGAQARVCVGRGGLGWGRGWFPSPQPGPEKGEGDGRSPAGVFSMRYAFGTAPLEAMKGIRFPYTQITSTLECVDDVKSSFYNQLADRTNVVKPDWRSSERMASLTNEYRLGVVVDHNILEIKPGAGSCIFLHIWKAPNVSTSGCTAMPLGDLEAIVGWLDLAANPMLVQLPKSEYQRLKDRWRLPDMTITNALSAPSP